MLLTFMLPLLLLSQTTLSSPTYRDLMDLARLLDVEKRNDDEKPDYDDEKFMKICHQEPIELGLVIDSSASIHPDDFQIGQDFLANFLKDYDIGSGKNQVRVAAVTFGKGVYTEDAFNLNTFKLKQDVLSRIANMKFHQGSYTSTGDALQYMRTQQMVNTRSWAPKIVIVLTDGNSQKWRYTKEQAELLIAGNVTVFAVGVGESVKERELLNIAGNHPERVLRAKSYGDLESIKEILSYKTCVLKPRPTTTTTTTTTPPPKATCGEEFPSDVNFVFSPAALGLDQSGWVTQFISHTMSDATLTEDGEDAGFFRYGVVSGDCPDNEGFRLNDYEDLDTMRSHLELYDTNNLPYLVSKAANTGYLPDNGGRANAQKIAVIFVGKAKMDTIYFRESIAELTAAGVQVFVSKTESDVHLGDLPDGVRVLDHGSSRQQAEDLVSHICHLDAPAW